MHLTPHTPAPRSPTHHKHAPGNPTHAHPSAPLPRRRVPPRCGAAPPGRGRLPADAGGAGLSGPGQYHLGGAGVGGCSAGCSLGRLGRSVGSWGRWLGGLAGWEGWLPGTCTPGTAGEGGCIWGGLLGGWAAGALEPPRTHLLPCLPPRLPPPATQRTCLPACPPPCPPAVHLPGLLPKGDGAVRSQEPGQVCVSVAVWLWLWLCARTGGRCAAGCCGSCSCCCYLPQPRLPLPPLPCFPATCFPSAWMPTCTPSSRCGAGAGALQYCGTVGLGGQGSRRIPPAAYHRLAGCCPFLPPTLAHSTLACRSCGARRGLPRARLCPCTAQ